MAGFVRLVSRDYTLAGGGGSKKGAAGSRKGGAKAKSGFKGRQKASRATPKRKPKVAAAQAKPKSKRTKKEKATNSCNGTLRDFGGQHASSYHGY